MCKLQHLSLLVVLKALFLGDPVFALPGPITQAPAGFIKDYGQSFVCNIAEGNINTFGKLSRTAGQTAVLPLNQTRVKKLIIGALRKRSKLLRLTASSHPDPSRSKKSLLSLQMKLRILRRGPRDCARIHLPFSSSSSPWSGSSVSSQSSAAGSESSGGISSSPEPTSGATAIARWDVVPYQTFSDTFNVGVVAFHQNGIDRVVFSANGGPWTAAGEMTNNPQTGVTEYWTTLRAADFADGPVEVRAIAYPKIGRPRVLDGRHDGSLPDSRIRGEYTLVLYANARHTLPQASAWVSPIGHDINGDGSRANPYATLNGAIEALAARQGNLLDGSTIYLEPGDYTLAELSYPAPQASHRWLTIRGGGPDSADKFRITAVGPGNGRTVKLLKLEGIALTRTPMLPAGGGTQYNCLWTDHAELYGNGILDSDLNLEQSRWRGGVYSTDDEYHDTHRAVKGVSLIRNPYVHDIGGDAFRELHGMAINVRIENLIHVDGNATHPDVMQFHSNAGNDPFENIIIYGLKAVHNIAGQALFVSVDTADNGINRDWAIVNYNTDATGGGGAQLNNNTDHFLLWNLTIANQGFAIRDSQYASNGPTSMTNLSIRNSVFHKFMLNSTGDSPTFADSSWADNNHYIDVTSYGAQAPGNQTTSGGTYEQLFVAPAEGDFRPAANSILVEREAPLVPVDLEGNSRKLLSAIGAYEASEMNKPQD